MKAAPTMKAVPRMGHGGLEKIASDEGTWGAVSIQFPVIQGADGGGVNLLHLVYKNLQLKRATICPPGTMHRVVVMIETGALKPILADTFALADLGKAQEVFMRNRHVSNIVVCP